MSISQITSDCFTAQTLRFRFHTLRVNVDQSDFSTLLSETFRNGQTETTCPAGDNRNLSSEWLFRLFGEFDLLERPVFDVEEVFFAKSLELVNSFGATDHFDGRFSYICTDASRFLRRSCRKQTNTIDVENPRHRVEHGFATTNTRIVAFKIVFISSDIRRDTVSDNLRPALKIMCIRRR